MDWNTKKNIVMSFGEKNTKMTTQQKRGYVKQFKNICNYCGGVYKKYLYCLNINDNISISCKLCYVVTHIDYYMNSKEIILLYSTIDQIDIIRKTVDGIMENSCVPFYDHIDPNVKIPQPSLLEYMAIKDELGDNNYKIFFTDKLDDNFVTSLLNIEDEYMFDTDETPKESCNVGDNNEPDFSPESLQFDRHPFTDSQFKIMYRTFNMTYDYYILREMELRINKMLYIVNADREKSVVKHSAKGMLVDSYKRKLNSKHIKQ